MARQMKDKGMDHVEMKRIFALLLALTCLLAACAPAEENSSVRSADGVSSHPLPSSAASSEQEPPPEATPEPSPEPEPEPVNDWEQDLPENHGMDPVLLEQMRTALKDAPVYAVLMVKDGVIVDEYYQEGQDETSVFPFHSASKSVTSALFGIALEEGAIGSVDDLLSDYLPQVLEQEDAGKHALTLRHLLTQTSGLEWYEWGGSYSNWGEFRSAENWVDYILGRSLVSEPGSAFNYSTGNTHLLAAALEQATGKNLFDYAKEKLFVPMGMDSVIWGTDPQGIADGGNGVVMSARDAAKFGQLFLEGGVWNGQQLVPADWVSESTAAKNNGAGDSTGAYGYQWWIRSFDGCDTFYAFGAWGQYIFVVPELELVTVIASPGPQNSYASRNYFISYILPACHG